MPRKYKKDGLGKTLIKEHKSGAPTNTDRWLHTSELSDGYDWGRLNLTSVTEENHLDEFLRTAELAGTEFTAEKLQISVVGDTDSYTGLPATSEKRDSEAAQLEHKHFLCIPRRPSWSSSTTPEQLKSKEQESFLAWRRQLAALQENDKLTLTPFERNLEFWRQLWRVVEKSDIVVQIVDARNPLLFRCEDLERYIIELNPLKKNVILMSKCDLLTPKQRATWLDYFQSQGVAVAFWSSKIADETAPVASSDTVGGAKNVDCVDVESSPNIQDDRPLSGFDVNRLMEGTNAGSDREDQQNEGSDSDHKGSDGDHEGSDDEEEDHQQDQDSSCGDGQNEGSDDSHEGSDGDHKGSDGDHEGSNGDVEDYQQEVDGSCEDEQWHEGSDDHHKCSKGSDGNVEEVEVCGPKTSILEKYGKGTILSDNDRTKELGAVVNILDENEQKDICVEDKSGIEQDRSRLLSSEELLDFFRNICPAIQTASHPLTVGLVGYPNVGKSSTINSLLRAKKVPVSATPGRTKHFQTLFVDESMVLCDCPGLVFPNFISTKADMVCNGILPIDQMRDHVPPVSLVCSRIPRKLLEQSYGIVLPLPREGEDPHRPPYAHELLSAYGHSRGFMTTHGLPDEARSARYILKDYVNGNKLLHCEPPPGMDCAIFNTQLHETTDQQVNKVHSDVLKLPVPTFDKAFFRQTTSVVHSKVVTGTSGTGVSIPNFNSQEKPWKKHNNRHKKEKIKRAVGKAHRDNY